MKRIVTIQDISCVGKCSLTVALPILSAMGIETAILPTAVLSNHTAFSGFTYCDLTEQIEPICQQWEKENLSFDAVYTGYLGSKQQIELMKTLFQKQREQGALIFVDPVMADNGVLYKGFDGAYATANTELCRYADVIVPNLTEACLMTGVPYQETYEADYIETLLQALGKLGAKQVVLTGVRLHEGRMGVIGLHTETGERYFYESEYLPVSLHGTGDIFSSTLLGGLMRGLSLQNALILAVDFTVESIRQTMQDGESRWYGASFEAAFPYLLERLSRLHQ